MKKIYIGLCLVALLHPNNTQAMSDVAGLGLDVATATMDSKSAKKGLEKLAKDKTTEWMWDSVGGFEKILLQNSEAEMLDATKKLSEIVNIVQSINKIAISIAKGNYDTAAIEAMDQVVGKVNHPLVTATWSAVKLAYESHKLVISIENALQVEILYNIVNHDRMLLGASDPNKSFPPQIPVNTNTADYFFNKYIMTNDSARKALKAYVTTVLGEEWPEQSWSDWLGSFRTIGMGLDSKKNAELEMLDKEWRNKGRGWVIAVIKEINKQARQSWAQLKVRQEMAAFKRFASKVGFFNKNELPRMLKDFRELQKYKSELPKYKEALENSKKARQQIQNMLSNLTTKSFTQMPPIKGIARTNVVSYLLYTSSAWKSSMMVYASRAGLLRKKSLSSSLYSEMNMWRKINNQVSDFAQANGEVAGRECAKEELKLQQPPGNPSDAPISYAADKARLAQQNLEAKKFYAMHKDKIKPFEWKSVMGNLESSEELKEKLLKILNKGDIKLARNVFAAWNTASGRAFSSYIRPYSTASNRKFPYSIPELPKYDDSDRKRAINIGWSTASGAIIDRMSIMYQSATEKYNQQVTPIAQMMSSFESLAQSRMKQCQIYVNTLNQIYSDPDLKYFDLNEWNDSLNKCSKYTYTKLPKLDEDFTGILSLPWVLNQEARKVFSSNCIDPTGLIKSREIFNGKIKKIKNAISDYKRLPVLNTKEMKELKVFGKCSGLEKLIKGIPEVEKKLEELNQYAGMVDKTIPKAQLDIENREKDKYWLENKAKDVQAFIDYILESGKVKKQYNKVIPNFGLSLVLPKNIVMKDKMLMSNDSPAHYLTRKEINNLAQPYVNMYKEGTPIQTFLNTYFPKVSKNMSNFLSMKFLNAATEENIIVMNKTVLASDIQKLENILAGINVKEDSFDTKIATIPECFPNVTTFRKFYFEDVYIDKTELNKTILGKKFLKLREKVKELFLLRRAFLITEEQRINRIKTEEEIKRRDAEAQKKSIKNSIEEEVKANANMKKLEDIESLYNKFSQYYSEKNIASLMSLLSDDWKSSSDGTTLMDLEDTLDNSFSIFDEVQCSIDSLNITNIEPNRYSVTYVITIKGLIYDEDIEHLEKSSVNEEIRFDNEVPKIYKTLSGKYWKTR